MLITIINPFLTDINSKWPKNEVLRVGSCYPLCYNSSWHCKGPQYLNTWHFTCGIKTSRPKQKGIDNGKSVKALCGWEGTKWKKSQEYFIYPATCYVDDRPPRIYDWSFYTPPWVLTQQPLLEVMMMMMMTTTTTTTMIIMVVQVKFCPWGRETWEWEPCELTVFQGSRQIRRSQRNRHFLQERWSRRWENQHWQS